MIDFAAHLLRWRIRHKLTEKEAAAVLGVSTVAVMLWEKPGYKPTVREQATLLERMQKFKRPKL
jgi:DNA-binding XRE family transcriptional regulator